MADESTATADKKTITHNLTRGAALLLKDHLPGRGWYKEQPIEVTLDAVNVAQSKLVDLKQLPLPEDKETAEAYEGRVAEMANEPVSLELTEGERKACRKCVREHLRQGVWVLTAHVANLIKELEVD